MCRNLMWAWKKLVDNNKFKVTFDCAVKDNPNLEQFENRGPYLLSHIKLPCGQCIDCRLQRARTWADRCMLEMKQYGHNYFITLTYDNDHLPTMPGVDIETGDIRDRVGTLRPKDLQDFMKRLRITWKRKYGHDNIRFYACGEYGDLRERPHYHAIIFNLPIPDLKYSHNSKREMPIYSSDVISSLWSKGIVSVQDVTWETCAYTARYIMKKQTGKGSADYYNAIGREPEFVRMSRMPGIGRAYYDLHKSDIYLTDEIFVNTKKGVNKVRPARYYDKLYDVEYPDEMRIIKKQRQDLAQAKLDSKLRYTDMSYSEMLDKEEMLKNEQIKALKRNYERG